MHLEQLLESYAHSNGLSRVTHEYKLLLAGVALLTTVFSTSPVAPLAIFAAMSAALLLLARIPPRAYLVALTAPAGFALPVLLLLPFFVAEGEPMLSLSFASHTFVATKEGVNQALLLTSRVLAGSASLFFIIFTTPTAAIFRAMRTLRLPALFVEMCMLIYRFLFLLIDEAERMLKAQKVRLGYASRRRSFDSFALLASNLFLRSYMRAEQAFSALEARGYTGNLEFADFGARGATPVGLALVLLLSSAMAVLAYLTRNLELV